MKRWLNLLLCISGIFIDDVLSASNETFDEQFEATILTAFQENFIVY